MKRYCLECGGYYSPNVGEGGRMPKGYKICPKCGGATKEYCRPKFTGTTFNRNSYDDSLRKWNEMVKENNAIITPMSTVDLSKYSWRSDKSRLNCLGL